MAHQDFYDDIIRFNALYKLDSHDQPTLLPPERLAAFSDILNEEVQEVHDIQEKYEKAKANSLDGTISTEDRTAILTDLSDWLGDIVVYCASEARRWGLPLKDILSIIMQSNFSKLDAEGNPIYDHRGKVMKGPNYWKPEPKIAERLVHQPEGFDAVN